jgi:hypothetical protein
LLLVPGIELNGHDTNGRPYHLVGLGIATSVSCADGLSLQGAIDGVRAAGGLAVLAHPYWTGQTLADLLQADGASGIEVFNGVCEKEQGKGLASVHWDDLLAAGKRLWGFAVDDAHGHSPDGDLGWGWVMVKASRLNQETILEALTKGAFYSSSGPAIHDISLKQEAVTVCCSPVERVHFICDAALGGVVHSWGGPPLTEARFRLRSRGETYLRIELVDPRGRRAWSQPIFLGG